MAITYYTADELRASLAGEQDAARAACITEAGDDLVGGFYHEAKGDEWIVRRLDAPGGYIVTGSHFERLVYDEHITPLLLAAYEQGLRTKLEASGYPTDAPILFLNGLRTTVCLPYCHPARAHRVNQTLVDDDEWEAVREVIARAKEGQS